MMYRKRNVSPCVGLDRTESIKGIFSDNRRRTLMKTLREFISPDIDLEPTFIDLHRRSTYIHRPSSTPTYVHRPSSKTYIHSSTFIEGRHSFIDLHRGPTCLHRPSSRTGILSSTFIEDRRTFIESCDTFIDLHRRPMYIHRLSSKADIPSSTLIED